MQKGSMMKQLTKSMNILAESFVNRSWRYLRVPDESAVDQVYAWPGMEHEDIMICVHRGTEIHETFHRQDFFFFNFAYIGDYGAISYEHDNHITVHEGECYIGQPHTGYALTGSNDTPIIIVGILIRKETFFRYYLTTLATDASMFRFFLTPGNNRFSDEYIRLKFDDDAQIRMLLEMMIVEYANPNENTQDILKPLVLTLLMQITRQYKKSNAGNSDLRLSDKIMKYMADHNSAVSLKEIAAHFSYHPNYISSLIHKEIGRSFSELQLEQRMEKAAILLKGTDLSVSEIAFMLGYSNNSNFYKAFREYYGTSPREFLQSATKSS